MKRIGSALLILALIISSLTLTSCGKNDGAPDGMQLVRGGDEVGYSFYGPEEWTVSNVGDISCTYASKIDLSSMTFTETEKPSVTIGEYFEGEKAKFPYEISVSVNGEECLFGNADGKAYKFVYSYTYKERSYSCMQIFVNNSEDFYIFTYTASNEKHADGESYYDRYLDKVSAAIDAFTFTNKSEESGEAQNYEVDKDGYILISDKTLSGFDMYVPNDYKVNYSSVIVSASKNDGTTVTMSQATYTGVTNEDYWTARRNSIEAFADRITDPTTGEEISSLTEIELAKQIELEGVNWALAYEYTYALDGVRYHVYQVLIVEGAINGYVFTYTASEENYAKNYSEMETVLRKIEY